MILQTYKRPKSIAHGKDGCIFQIAKGLVAKIGYGEAKTQHDAKIAERLYAEGISVPVPYGVNPVTFPAKTIQDAFSGRTINGFVMDKVIGKTGFQLRGLGLEIIDEAYNLLNREISRAIRKGFTPSDFKYPGNFIFTPEHEIKLLDFTWWSHRDIPLFS